MSGRSLAVLPLLLAALVFSARCGGSKGGTPDAGSQDNGNGGVGDGGTSGATACITIATWAGVDPQAGYVANQNFPFNIALSFVDFPGSYSLIQLEDYHASNTYPKSASFTPDDRYFTCDTCVTLWDGCVDANGGTTCQGVFFQQGGSATITQATQSPDAGRFAATMQNLKLVEWVLPQADGGGDFAKPNGRCYDVGAASFDVTWP